MDVSLTNAGKVPEALQEGHSKRIVTVTLHHGTPFVWNAQDAYYLRKMQRLYLDTVGGIPSLPRQNKQHSLPGILSREQVTIGIRYGFIRLIDGDVPLTHRTDDERQAFEQTRADNLAQQAQRHAEAKRRKEALVRQLKQERSSSSSGSVVSSTVEAPASESRQEGDDELADAEEKVVPPVAVTQNQATSSTAKQPEGACNAKTTPAIVPPASGHPSEDILKQIKLIDEDPSLILKTTLPIAKPARSAGSEIEISHTWAYPVTPDEILRYTIYEDLWKKGFYISAGPKFGGDYLLYTGDPLKFHASFVVIVMPRDFPVPIQDLVGTSRLAIVVKKIPVIATLSFDGTPAYYSYEWVGVT